MTQNQATYKDAGVDIAAGNTLVKNITPLAKATHRAEVLNHLGGFSGLCGLPKGYQEPVLTSATDGVGTKLEIAQRLEQHGGVGVDLVAMCVNDLVVCGAEPLFFLDYFATGKLKVDVAAKVIEGIAEGCKQAGCALIGGETAEMPGFYPNGAYDLAGFAVGVVEKSKILNGQETVSPGDQLIGIASTGLHANGFSLVRKLLKTHDVSLDTPFEGTTLGETLLRPTQIYVKPLLSLMKKDWIRAAAHITGGGLLENLPRVLPKNVKACIKEDSWSRPEIFNFLQKMGNIASQEMYLTFNCGIGMVLVVAREHCEPVIQALSDAKLEAWPIGTLETRMEDEAEVSIS